MVYQLLEHIGPALEEAGDTREVTGLVHRLMQHGTGADRQRQTLADGGPDAVIDMLTEATVMP
ncbi:Putative glutamate--cysteine ligase 2 OS=Streptomyces glaucescens OX=1907 GN=SGLAU_01600 PE=3 SV=1 [Streptomyces glaucescens]